MSNKSYISIPLLDTLQDVVDQYKIIYIDENPHQVIHNWLEHCFKKSPVGFPEFAIKNYQVSLNFLYNYRDTMTRLAHTDMILNAFCNGAGLYGISPFFTINAKILRRLSNFV